MSEMPTVMILAAGRGTRLQHLTVDTPKPMVTVGEVKPIERTMSLLHRAGYRKAVVNTCYLADKMEAQLKAHPCGLDVHISHEENMLETGGGIKNALPLIGSNPFVAINGDVVWGEESLPLLPLLPKLFNPDTMDGLLVLVPKEKALAHHGAGDFLMDEHGRLTHRGEEASAPFVYTGIQMLHPRLLDGASQAAFPLLPCYLTAAKKGRLYGYVYDGPWVDMGTPDGLVAADDLLRRWAA